MTDEVGLIWVLHHLICSVSAGHTFFVVQRKEKRYEPLERAKAPTQSEFDRQAF
jgi:hypothetical protein